MSKNNEWSRIAQSEPLLFVSRWDNTPQPYVLALPHDALTGEPTNLHGIVIYLHGHGSNWRQGFFSDTYGGTFGRLHAELQKRQLAYATLDYRGTTSWMGPAAEADLTQLIEILTCQLGTNRLFLIGGSMGGSSTMAYAVRHADLLSGVLALCPTTDIGDFHRHCRTRNEGVCAAIADAIKTSYGATPANDPALFESRSALTNYAALTVPTVLVHGSADTVIPVSYSRELYARLRTLKTPLLYEEIEEGDHDAPVVLANWGRYFDFLEENAGPASPAGAT